MSIRFQPSARFRPYVAKLLACGHWAIPNQRIINGDCAILIHKKTGATVAYGLHDGGNDINGPRNFAALAGQICGCAFIEPRGRKRSRKAILNVIAEREAELRVHQEINRLLWARRDHVEAIENAARAAYNTRTREGHLYLSRLRRELAEIDLQLEAAWPGWKEEP